MLIAEYSYETDIEVQREEAFEEGLEKGELLGAEQNRIQTAKNMITMGLTLEQIVQATELSFEKVQEIYNQKQQNK
jgi:predicted transposase/invertase (TIGR01784 family)